MNEPGKPHGLTAGLASLGTFINGTILEEDEAGAREALLMIAARALFLAIPTTGATAEDRWRLEIAKAVGELILVYSTEFPPTEPSVAILRGATQRLDQTLFRGFALYARGRERAPPGAPGTSLSDLGLD
jgi:hypothetical protein